MGAALGIAAGAVGATTAPGPLLGAAGVAFTLGVFGRDMSESDDSSPCDECSR